MVGKEEQDFFFCYSFNMSGYKLLSKERQWACLVYHR